MYSYYDLHDEIDIHICSSDTVEYHKHRFLEIAYVISGSAEHNLNGEKSIISKGNYCIFDYDAIHSYRKIGKEKLEIINCLFFPGFIDKTLNKCKNFSEIVNSYMLKYTYGITNISPANYIFKDNDNEILTILYSMLNEYVDKKSGCFEILRCRLIEIIILTMRKSTLPKSTGSGSICDEIIKYTEQNISEKNILGTISKNVNFSTSYLSRKFKEKTAQSFSEYLQTRRIEQALRLLGNTDKKVTEIASLCGYSDMKFFNAIFKKRVGLTPREFRQRLL